MTGDWRFARRPFWLLSHLFAATVVVSFVGLGFWQLDRLDQRRAENAVIGARSADAAALDGRPAPSEPDGSDLDYRAVTAVVTFTDPDLVRIANRSRNGVAGEHVVALAELGDGSPLAVNRGFVPLNFDAALEPLPPGPVTVTGWLRATVERGGLGATDDGTGDLLPRLDTERIAARIDRDLPPVWLQLATVDGTAAGADELPETVALPPLDDGPHLGYAIQWFIFAALGAFFYGLLLHRRARGHRTTQTTTTPPPGSERVAMVESVGHDDV